ncbi:MAG: toll/interleukin-1 receptor domain-containing protein [Planctomycetes bacterium]|nr:toll/interleukin-1 receptor domain-containing protein [Planctomycetota bacterium]
MDYRTLIRIAKAIDHLHGADRTLLDEHAPAGRPIAFISWSGARSRQVGVALCRFLGAVVQAVEPWLSDEISTGSNWNPEIWTKLRQAKACVLCFTKDNLLSPWMHAEGGALLVKNRRVLPYLFEVTPNQIAGPFASLQSSAADRTGTLKLAKEINAIAGRRRIPDELLKECFELHWPTLERELNRIAAIAC